MFHEYAANPAQVNDDNGGLAPTLRLSKREGDVRGLG
jgi:hypothetical protein